MRSVEPMLAQELASQPGGRQTCASLRGHWRKVSARRLAPAAGVGVPAGRRARQHNAWPGTWAAHMRCQLDTCGGYTLQLGYFCMTHIRALVPPTSSPRLGFASDAHCACLSRRLRRRHCHCRCCCHGRQCGLDSKFRYH